MSNSPQKTEKDKRNIRKGEDRRQKTEVRMNSEGVYSVFCLLYSFFTLLAYNSLSG
jgi:hypothetical protein